MTDDTVTTEIDSAALAWKGASHPVEKINPPGIEPRPFLVLAAENETRSSKSSAIFFS